MRSANIGDQASDKEENQLDEGVGDTFVDAAATATLSEIRVSRAENTRLGQLNVGKGKVMTCASSKIETKPHTEFFNRSRALFGLEPHGLGHLVLRFNALQLGLQEQRFGV